MSNVTLISPPEQHLLMEAGDRPNLGILYLAASLKNNGHNPLISDLNHDSYKDLNEKMEISDFAGMTTITPYFDWVTNFSAHLKQNFPNIPLIGGGPHATVDPSSLVNFDYVVVGEGERALVDIVNDFGEVDVKHVIYPYEKDLDKLPIPHRVMPKDVYGLNQEGYKTMTLMTSRSCPYDCFFCTKNVLGKTQRFHSIDRVIQEIKELKMVGYNSFYFLDDTFTTNKKRAYEFAQRVIDEDLHISYRIVTRTDSVNEDLLAKMKEGGLRSISFGLEHMDDKVLELIQKRNTVENHINAIKLSKKLGLKVRGSFILNLPGATRETAYDCLDAAMVLDLDFADFYPLVAYPKTPLWDNPKEYGAEINRNYIFYQSGRQTNVWFENFGWDVNELVKDIREKWAEYKGVKCPWESDRNVEK